MDTSTILIVAGIACLVLTVGFVLFVRRRAVKRRTRSVEATITSIQVEASTISSWWTITAGWSDPLTGQHLSCRSPHLQFPPKHHQGERVTVTFDAARP